MRCLLSSVQSIDIDKGGAWVWQDAEVEEIIQSGRVAKLNINPVWE